MANIVAPVPTGGPDKSWEHRELYDRVIDAIYAVPVHFKNELNITGAVATDLFTLNSALGAAIEHALTESLNALRPVWDPDNKYQAYSFVRQAQTFPDVRLQTNSPGITPEIIMGIELKGWFIMSKEGEPSFRYKPNPLACAESDLLVIFPWMLSDVVAGRPKLFRPFVCEARYAAEHRNHYWRVLRGKTGKAAEVIEAEHKTPYPAKCEKYLDRAKSDAGGNFGRVARGNFMTDYIKEMMEHEVVGIPIAAWQRFLKIFSERHTADDIQRKLNTIMSSFTTAYSLNDKKKKELHSHLYAICKILADE